jgi:pantoate--beta-alanine ligase
MRVLKKVTEARDCLATPWVNGKTLGLVPTMGALHEGHLSLIREAMLNNEQTIVSIFVNPLQFNNPEDLEKYPVSIAEDLKALEKLGVDYVFMPSHEEMYPKPPVLDISFGHLEKVMEGQYRPGHFNGVAIIVAKLFNILSPTKAYFGQKDLQQFKIIEQLVNDLSMTVELVMMPIIREENGLAMSSRNRRLSTDGRTKAGLIYSNLSAAAKALKDGENQTQVLAKTIDAYAKITGLSIEYFELADLEDLRPAGTDTAINRLVLCFAGYIEEVRLIDNVIVGKK